ncbi:MAG TPA: hypothetical protein IAC52_00990 [Candidatus Enteromonas pullicola]|uniref:RDD domain-containing protein n=1 Tax=Candidatus Alloenteromonas pullicola TaxID=2840784 RepID=A0A9D1LN06_9FIRM|nr:hypothetical protein [Candidatus Enteromonas pullicola]
MSGWQKEGRAAKMAKRNRNQNLGVEPASLPRILLGSALNFLFIIVAWIAVYFSVCYPITINSHAIEEANDYNDSLLTSLDLKLPSNSSQEEFKQAVDDFYFVEFPEEIEDLFVPEGYSLIAYYNVNVLRLPEDPSPTNYKTQYFSYILVDGLPDVNQIGQKSDDLGKRGEEDVRSIYSDAYSYLKMMLQEIDPEYEANLVYINTSTMYGVVSSFLLSYAVFMAVIPFLTKNRGSLGDALLRVGTCGKDGYRTSAVRILAKALVGLPLPLLTAIFLNAYTATLLLAFPYFLNLLYCILFQKREPFLETISGIVLIDNSQSTVFNDDIDEMVVGAKALSSYTDPEYVTKLAAAESMDVKDEDGKA